MPGWARLLLGIAAAAVLAVAAHAGLVATMHGGGRIGAFSAASCAACHGGR